MKPEVKEAAMAATKGMRRREDIVDAALACAPELLVVQSPDRITDEALAALQALAEREDVLVVALPKGWEGTMEKALVLDGKRYMELPE